MDRADADMYRDLYQRSQSLQKQLLEAKEVRRCDTFNRESRERGGEKYATHLNVKRSIIFTNQGSVLDHGIELLEQ